MLYFLISSSFNPNCFRADNMIFFLLTVQWGWPKFSLTMTLAMLPALFVSIVESVGNYYTCANIASEYIILYNIYSFIYFITTQTEAQYKKVRHNDKIIYILYTYKIYTNT